MLAQMKVPEGKEVEQFKSLIGGKIIGLVWDNVELEDAVVLGFKIEMPKGDIKLVWPLSSNLIDKGAVVIDDVARVY